MSTIHRTVPLAVLLLAAAGCSGSGQTPPAQSPGTPAAAAPLLHATFTMHWGGTAPQATRRAPKYVAATTRSVAIVVNNGTAQITNAPLVGQPQTTNIAIDAPVGMDTFTISAYDATNGVGNVLSHAVVSQRINPDVPNVLSASLNGVLSKATVSLANPTPPAGVAATSAVNVTAFDPDGNVIVGSADYDRPVLLANSDTSGATSLSTTTVPNASTPVTLSYNGKALTSATLSPGVGGTSATFAPVPTIYEYTVPSVVAQDLTSIAAGPDGNVWFTENQSNAIGKITPAGVISTFPISTPASTPFAITGAPDGALWFTQPGTNQVGRMTTQGALTEYAFPKGQNTQGAIVASQQYILFLERPIATGNAILGVVAYNGGTQEIALGNSGSISGAALAADGTFWYLDGQLRRYVVSQPPDAFALPSGCSSLQGMTAGPDGNLWYLCEGSNYVVRATTAGVQTAFHVPGVQSYLISITAAPDGALWFTEAATNKIGRITTSGTVTEYSVPTAASEPYAITAGPDGNVWFTEYTGGKIGKLVY